MTIDEYAESVADQILGDFEQHMTFEQYAPLQDEGHQVDRSVIEGEVVSVEDAL